MFCAQESLEARENPIGTAGTAAIYVLVECPPPWTRNALDSKPIPANLRDLEEELLDRDPPGYILLIYSDRFSSTTRTRCLIYEQNSGLTNGYSKKELSLPQIEDVAPAVKDYLTRKSFRFELEDESSSRDILVCTHGSHDRCCAKYGNVFYRQALKVVTELSLPDVRIWQTTHFGGHRFAPTAIDFPEGRYYARLDRESLTSILTKTGNIESLKDIYRGSSVLSWAAQFLEKELLLEHGWDWFDYRVSDRTIQQNEDESFNRVELTFENLDKVINTYQADVVIDESKALCLRGSCQNEESSECPQYVVKNICKIQ
ncbi:MAG: sucrase ferredoxin [Cyanosarcina radialis HA8281-LM2]|jgi:hypothetical protein|nr:sucrase ferredoxin [Cyanosarcina radialis HA8281-LM2]